MEVGDVGYVKKFLYTLLSPLVLSLSLQLVRGVFHLGFSHKILLSVFLLPYFLFVLLFSLFYIRNEI